MSEQDFQTWELATTLDRIERGLRLILVVLAIIAAILLATFVVLLVKF